MAEDNKKKKKSDDVRVDSGGTVEEVVSEHSSMKKEKEKKKKKKNREIKDDFAGEDGEIAERESEKLGEKKKSKKQVIDSEAGDGMKKKKSKKDKEAKVDSEAVDGVEKKKKKKKKSKKESGSDVLGNSESSKVCVKRKREDCGLGDEEYTDKEVKRKSKKKKASFDSETSLNSTNDAKRNIMVTNTSVDPEDDNKDSTKHAKKERKKKEKQQSVDSEVEDDNLINSTNDSELEEHNKDSKKDAKKIQNVDSEAEENDLNSTKDAKKKRKKKKKKQSEVSGAGENNNDGKDAKKKRKKKQSEVSEAEENNNDAKKKRKKKKKQECGQSDKDVTTPSSTSTKRVTFSDQVEFFPAEDEESEEDEAEVKLVRGKRFTKEEDELVKKAVLEYVDNHALGDDGVKMVMECKSHKQLKGCWKEIASALPWRAYDSVYHRAHTIFEEGSKGVWTQEDLELVIEFQKKHGNDWRTLADALGKDRKHVKDAWRRIRLASKKKGHWTREEYQNLFDLVNKDIRMKAFQEKHSKHGMLKDNIPWMAISDVLGTRDHVTCCTKWYDQLTSPMVAKGTWANVDDYRLLEELLKLDAACIDDVDWDYLLENRDGEACRKRWDQMVLHIGIPKSKTFLEQVEILSERYRPDIAEDREDFDNRPYDPED